MSQEFSFYLNCITRLIYVVTDEEDRFLNQLREGLRAEGQVDNVRVYNAAFGLMKLGDLLDDWRKREHKVDKDTLNIHDALTAIYKDNGTLASKYYVLTDPERWLADVHVQRRVLNILHQMHNDSDTAKVLICVSSRRFIPEKLARYTEVVHDVGLGADEILKVAVETCAALDTPVPDGVEALFKGLTSFEVQSAVIQGYKRDGLQDREELARYKFRQLKKTDLLQFVDTAIPLSQIGGAGRLKKWAEIMRAAWTPEGLAFGLEPPKGVLLVGVWGTGKSISAKALGATWGLPVIQLEMGKLRTAEVGGTEANVYRAIRIIEAMAPCVTGETLVTLADGTQEPIQTLWEQAVADPSLQLEVMCWDEANLKVATTRVNFVTKRRAEAYHVGAANGFYIRATGNHLHYVMRGGAPEWVRTDELSTGDMLAVPTAVHSGNDSFSQFHPAGLREYEATAGAIQLRRGGGGYRDAVVSKLPASWTADLGWLLGMIEGDGFIGKNDGIGLTNTEPQLLDRFEAILARDFGLVCKRRLHEYEDLPALPGLSSDPRFKPCWTTTVCNQLAAETLRSARDGILSAPPAARAGFLAGWIDADGCVQPEKICLTVKHPMMWHQRCTLARQLIQSLGVVPSKFEMPLLEVTGSRAVALSRIIAEHLTAKGGKALHVRSSEIGFDRGMGFACGQLVRELRKASGLTFSELAIPASTNWGHEQGRVKVSVRHLREYVDAFGRGTELERILNAECRWVEIVSLEPIGEHDVFDLACQGDSTHSFLANGLVTHNCLIWVDEAEKSMAGSHSSSHTDAGTTSRSIGIFSTWLAETRAPVCLAMTANSLKTLPVEFVNRMDDRWFFDLPSSDDRIDILKIHMAKRRQDPDRFDLAGLADKAKLLVGREIEQAIKAALITSFCAGKKALDEALLAIELERKPRIVKTMVAEINETLEWVGFDPDVDDGIRARFAADPAGRDRAFTVS